MATQPIDFSDLGGKAVQAPTRSGASSGQALDFSDLGGKVVQAAGQAGSGGGEIKNDVGNTVIVPREGESFQDTMKRAAAYGKTVTPQQISAEVQTMPGKAAEALAAGPALGFAQPAAVASLASLLAPTAGRTLFEAQGPSLLRQGATALAPIVKKYGIKALEGAGLGAGLSLYKDLKKVFEGPGQ